MERTLVIFKPDAIRRGLVGQILSRFERAGLEIVDLSKNEANADFWFEFYQGLAERPEVYDRQVNFMLSGPTIFLVLEGDDAIHRVRKLVGATMPREAAAGTIRGDFGSTLPETLVHASDSAESFRREWKLITDNCVA